MKTVSTTAQNMQHAKARPDLEKKYNDLEGNPYLTEDWVQGTVSLASGESYKDVPLKFDLVRNEPLFQNSKGEAMSFVSAVRKFSLINPTASEKSVLQFRNGFKAADGGTAETFYQVLTDGESPLLKKISKVVTETKPFNSATTIKTFDQVQILFIVKDGLPVKIRKDKKVVLEALGDYSAQLDEYIKTKKLNLKSEPDLIALVSYYNSLK